MTTPTSDAPSRAPTIRHESDVHGFITRTFFKIGPPGTVGVESEWFAVDDRQLERAVSIQRLQSLLLTAGPLPAGSTITFEPGGQVELSTAPAAGPAATVALIGQDLAAATARLQPAGIRLVASGADPARSPVRILDQPRYAAMERFFDSDGPSGRYMMTTSAAVQVSLDAGADPLDVRRRWRLANDLAPLLTATFANSPLHRGRPTGVRSSRQAFWSGIDPGRTRAPVGDDPAAAYARFALQARVMLLRRPGGRWLADPGITFAQWVAGEPGHRPTEDDLVYHLSTLFPPVRPRAWLELRSVDALPSPWWQVAVATCAVLLDDPIAFEVAAAAVQPVAGRWSQAIRSGLADRPLQLAADRCLTAVATALGSSATPPADQALAAAVQAYHERYVARGRTPADEVLDAHHRGDPPWQAVAAPTLDHRPDGEPA
jgi:glutamate--cysteine ligase